MPAVRPLQLRKTEDVVALARAPDAPLDVFDAAVAALDPAEKELALRTLGRATRQLDEQLGALREIAAALELLARVAAYRAVVLDVDVEGELPRIHVALLGQALRLVAGALPPLDPTVLVCGDEVEVVMTGPQQYAVRRRIGPHEHYGTVGRVEAVLGAGRLRITRGPDTLVLRTTPRLAAETADERTAVGRLVAYDEALGLAFTLFGETEQRELVLREVPIVRSDEVILAPRTARTLEDWVILPLRHPEAARALGVAPARFLLLAGPPGVGKTHCCRWLASELGRPIYLVSGSEIASKWFGETEGNLRARIRAAQAEPDGAVLVWDEAESLLVERGQSQVGVENRVLSVLLSATDGFTRPGNVLFVLTTNRLDQIDQALLRPLRAVTVAFERPGPAQTRSLFSLYLAGDDDAEAVARAGAAAVFSARDSLGAAVLRDGTRLPLTRPMAISGALVRASCERARRLAFARHVHANGGAAPRGLAAADLLAAIDEEFAGIARMLTAANAAHALTLPPGAAEQIVGLERDTGTARHRVIGGPLT